jgi:hypothetical protein
VSTSREPAGAAPPGPASPRGLGGTGRVADDLYLVAHDDATGRPLLQPRALGLGLAAGLLAELMLGAAIGVRADGTLAAGRTWPGCELGRRVRDLVAAEREPLAVRDWLRFLARTAADDVAERLERAGYLTRGSGWPPWRSRRRVPVDADWAFAPLLRVRCALDARRPLCAHDAVLAGLAVASGLGFRIERYLTPSRGAADAARQLDPGLRELIAQTRAAVDSAVLSRRA